MAGLARRQGYGSDSDSGKDKKKGYGKKLGKKKVIGQVKSMPLILDFRHTINKADLAVKHGLASVDLQDQT
jgi:hypothetical protein